ncbi:UNVERIFIED_CONTAM: hypothetical protein RMT77_014046 [Armadillidium vulgare]
MLKQDSGSSKDTSFSYRLIDSSEAITINKTSDEYKFDAVAIQTVLSDFQKLDFVNNPCTDPWDVINYNEGKIADPFDKIAKYYGRKRNIFLFIAMLRDLEQSIKIIEIIDKKCDAEAKEKFEERKNIYLDRIERGEIDAKEFLKSDSFTAFFNGCHVGPDRNIHENLNIDIIKSDEPLEIGSIFTSITKRIEEEKSEIKRVKVYSNGQRIVTVNKNEKQQRNYSFMQCVKFVLSWAVKDKSGKGSNCTIVLNMDPNAIITTESSVDGKNVNLKEILELAKQNKAVLIEGKALYEVLENRLALNNKIVDPGLSNINV